ncbi:hypothetical protein Dimus_035026 [Dionaea muscipula]
MFRNTYYTGIYRSSLVALNIVQACESEEDGLFGFDLHSDGEGRRHLNASIRYVEADGALGTNGIGFFNLVYNVWYKKGQCKPEDDGCSGRSFRGSYRTCFVQHSQLWEYECCADSFGMALDEAVHGGKMLPRHIIATSGFGAGLTWASAIVRWR